MLRAFLCLLIALSMTSCALWNPVEIKPETPPPDAKREAADALKKKVLILPFLNHSSFSNEEISKHAAEEVENAILRFPDLSPVSPDAIEGSEDFAADDMEYNYRLIFQKARAYGINAVALGAIEEITLETGGDDAGLLRTQTFAATATVRFELYDSTSERPIYSKLATEEIKDELSLFLWNSPAQLEDLERGKIAVSKTLEKILKPLGTYVRRIAWSGHIAKAELRRYYINAGEATGITLGQLLKVFEEGRPIQDPLTGQFIGVAPGRFKGLLRVVDHIGTDGAVAVVQSGGGFREKDRVEIFSPPGGR